MVATKSYRCVFFHVDSARSATGVDMYVFLEKVFAGREYALRSVVYDDGGGWRLIVDDYTVARFHVGDVIFVKSDGSVGRLPYEAFTKEWTIES